MSSPHSSLSSSDKRKLKRYHIPKQKRRAIITDDGRILHPTKGFLPQSLRKRNQMEATHV